MRRLCLRGIRCIWHGLMEWFSLHLQARATRLHGPTPPAPGPPMLERRGSEPGMLPKPEASSSLEFSDLMIWAVLLGNVELAEVFWAALSRQSVGDPIRIALIAAHALQQPCQPVSSVASSARSAKCAVHV